jgi:hypothetical protein
MILQPSPRGQQVIVQLTANAPAGIIALDRVEEDD